MCWQGLLLLSERQCSRVAEKLISLLANFLSFSPSSSSSSSNSSSSNSSSSNSSSSSSSGGRLPAAVAAAAAAAAEPSLEAAKLRCLYTWRLLLSHFVPLVSQLSVHPSGSHVLQTLLQSLPAAVQQELLLNSSKKAKKIAKKRSQQQESQDAAAAAAEQEAQTTADLFLSMMEQLR
ncbi:hypothetical protein, conserved [Eimeria tenella]|uniref:Uncharacterized protein n=1 Tax=Eimeria tenella TaxID=5802 RepID=U6KHI3_EIMTE|nr:hypothetical protein, conserved [Eimeria tenella]CDJ37379.1 hypothetical protein, conserved [Eimeria tenella]|eukprot:XP_013228217.1 hypothetical protein, conserved [Eimeria tenella]